MGIYAILVGVAGNEVLVWAELDSEIKTAELKNVSGNASFAFAALRLLIAKNRISLRSCTTTVLAVRDSADCVLMQHRQCDGVYQLEDW